MIIGKYRQTRRGQVYYYDPDLQNKVHLQVYLAPFCAKNAKIEIY